MNKKEKVSVIIPYHNTKEFIEECLNSVASQSYPFLEIVIINDGSDQEDTLFIESLLKDNRILYLKNDSRKGVAFSRNKGLAASSGDYVYFLDSDDILSPKALELMIKNIGDFPAITGITKKLLRPSDLEENIELREPELEEGEKTVESKQDNGSPILRNGWELFKSKSILNVLVKKEVFQNHGISFSGDTEGLTDLSGIIPLLLATGPLPQVKGHTYFKRVRNDPVSNPSLDQRPITVRSKEFIRVNRTLYKKYGHIEEAKDFLDTLFLKDYRKYILKLFKESEDFGSLFVLMSETANMIHKKKVSSQPIHIKNQLKHLIGRNEKKFRNSLNLYKEAWELKNALKGFTRLKKYIYKKIFLKFPLKENYIVFESFLGRNYSDSPRNIYEYITEHHPEYKCIWILNDKKKKIPGNAKVVKRFSLAYYYYFAVSKYWVNNMRQPLHLVKREGNVFLETWHGTPLKKLVFDMKDVYSANPRYKRDFYLQSRAWDYLISPNEYSSAIFRRAFKFEKEMLEYGYPRNDILYSPNRFERAEKVKASIGIPKEKKVILYAPTWRDDDYFEPGKYKFDLKLDLRKMREALGDEYVVALRMHYFIANDLNLDGMDGFAFNLSKYDDISELYLIADILITDYSSVFFDFANLKRPILFYTYDLEKYRDQLRGFYLDFERELPGPLLRTSEEVINAIANIEQVKEQYAPIYGPFYERFCSWHDGHATEKIVERVFLNQK